MRAGGQSYSHEVIATLTAKNEKRETARHQNLTTQCVRWAGFPPCCLLPLHRRQLPVTCFTRFLRFCPTARRSASLGGWGASHWQNSVSGHVGVASFVLVTSFLEHNATSATVKDLPWATGSTRLP